MFSSIEEEDRKIVIDRCFWPLLKLSEKGYKIGVEFTGFTLEIIMSIDPAWVKKFKILLRAEKLELIGSGYAQIIGPLIPAEVNDRNQKIGLEVYNKILGVTPQIALINEMAYSSGILEHYINNGYKAIIMEWNNPWKYHPEWDNEIRYLPQVALGNHHTNIPLLWADSIAFQKFQRYVHGEYSLEKYVTYLKLHANKNNRYFPLYTNDVEIFDFRPGRFETEVTINGNSEWDKIYELYAYLSKKSWCDFIFPSDVLAGLNEINGGKRIALESPAQPIPVKKQEKYNINRWALTGRSDLFLNTTCYKLYTKILELNEEKYWRKLCYFWSSDFRTHITSQRWNRMIEELISFEKEINTLQDEKEKMPTKNSTKNNNLRTNVSQKQNYLTIQNSNLHLILNIAKGCSIYSFKTSEFAVPLLGTLEHGYFEDIEYSADYFSGHLVINQLGEHKITDLSRCKPDIITSGDACTVHTESSSDKIKVDNSIIVKGNKLTLTKKIILSKREKQIIHPFHFTFIPEAWDQDSLYFATHNGGKELAFFRINNQDLNHGENLSFLISAKYGLGNTKGIVIIGDKNKEIVFSCNLEQSFLIPSVFYKKIEGNKFLLRLIYSAQEIDETFKSNQQVDIISSMISINVIM